MIAINYGRGVGRSLVHVAMRGFVVIQPASRRAPDTSPFHHKCQQQQRRIWDRIGVAVHILDIQDANARDPLEARAMWRRQGRALVIRATCVGGKVERFLAP